MVLAALFPDTVFLFLINASGAVFLFAYFMICISELRLRRRWEREEPGILQLRMWLYPVLPMLVTAAIVAVPVSMGLAREQPDRTAAGHRRVGGADRDLLRREQDPQVGVHHATRGRSSTMRPILNACTPGGIPAGVHSPAHVSRDRRQQVQVAR